MCCFTCLFNCLATVLLATVLHFFFPLAPWNYFFIVFLGLLLFHTCNCFLQQRKCCNLALVNHRRWDNEAESFFRKIAQMKDALKDGISSTHLPSWGETSLVMSEESFFFSSTRFSISFMRFPISSVILAAVSLSALHTRGGGVTPDEASLPPWPLLRSYFCFSLSFLGMTSSGVHESFKITQKTRRRQKEKKLVWIWQWRTTFSFDDNWMVSSLGPQRWFRRPHIQSRGAPSPEWTAWCTFSPPKNGKSIIIFLTGSCKIKSEWRKKKIKIKSMYKSGESINWISLLFFLCFCCF